MIHIEEILQKHGSILQIHNFIYKWGKVLVGCSSRKMLSDQSQSRMLPTLGQYKMQTGAQLEINSGFEVVTD